jgi:hypothetical protein
MRVPGRARVRLQTLATQADVEVETLGSSGQGEAIVRGEVPVLLREARIAGVHLRGAEVLRVRAGVEAAARASSVYAQAAERKEVTHKFVPVSCSERLSPGCTNVQSRCALPSVHAKIEAGASFAGLLTPRHCTRVS